MFLTLPKASPDPDWPVAFVSVSSLVARNQNESGSRFLLHGSTERHPSAFLPDPFSGASKTWMFLFAAYYLFELTDGYHPSRVTKALYP